MTLHSEMSSRRRPQGIRITKVGLWYVLFAVLVAIAATNTGNNALYLVVAVMLGALIVSGVVSRQNVDRLETGLEVPEEIYAQQPFAAELTLRNPSRWLPRWFLLVAMAGGGPPSLVAFLPRRATSRGRMEVLLRHRGWHAVPALHATSLFPFGFFRKGVSYASDREILVYPELYPAAAASVEHSGRHGEKGARRAGWGHDLHALRAFRAGDDPRSIHWKRSARTGDLVVMEREAEESRRLAILFDNGVGELADPAARERFERLVSEAATTAVDYLARGYEVELVTRDRSLPFARGRRHRGAVLGALALVAPVARAAEPLTSRDPGAPQVRLAFETEAGEEPSPAALAGRLGRQPAGGRHAGGAR